MTTPDDLEAYARALAAQQGLDPDFVAAIGQQESGFNPDAVSKAGAIGPMQLMPATAKDLGVNPSDPHDNVRGGVQYLAQLNKQFNGDPALVAAAYNAGPGAVQKAGGVPNFPETQAYVQKVTNFPVSEDRLVAQDQPVDDSRLVPADAPAAQPTTDAGPLAAVSAGLYAGLDRTAAGLRAITPAPVRDAVDWVNNKLGMGQVPSIDPAVQQANADALKPLEAKYPTTMALTESWPQLAAKTPLGMGAMAALGYGTPTQRLENGGLAWLGGKIGQGVGRLFGPASRAPIPDNGASEIFDYANSNPWGIPTTVGMNGSKTAKLAESVIANMPFVNGPVNSARDAAYQGFNRALSKTFGADSEQITPQLLGDAMDRSGKQIGSIMQKATAQLTPQQAQDVAHLSGVIADLGPEGAALNNRVGQLIDGMTNGQAMSGQTLRMLDSSLGRIIGGSQNGDLRYAAAGVQNILRDAATDSLSDADAAALKLARQQNFNVRQVADASKDGVLSPSKLLTQVNKYQRNARYGGGNDLAQLAQWAKPTLTDQIPNSGTAQRQIMQKILTSPITGALELGGIGLAANQTDHPYAATTAGLLAPFLVGRALAGKPASALTQQLLSTGGGLLGYQFAR